MRLEDFRKQYPQYNDISDEDLAKGLHRRFYSDIPFEDFSQRVGLVTAESGFVPALKAGVSGVQEAGYALAGRTGLMDEAAAQKAIEEEQAYQRRVFKPTEEGWTGAPVTKVTELLGQSLPYMGLPLAAAGATALAPLTGTTALVAGLGAAGLASGTQFTGTNLLRQMEATEENPRGRSIGETDLGNAALAAVPQAALDVLSFRMMPFIRGVFGQAGKEISEEAARRIASKNIKDVAADYALATGTAMTVEGLTEAAQQSLERLQAGLSITDQAARDEYLESFIGGAVLGGVLAPPGRYLERRSAQKEAPLPGAPQLPGAQPPQVQPPGAQPPVQPGVPPTAQPSGTPPGVLPGMVTEEAELTPEEEEELQAQIAGAQTTVAKEPEEKDRWIKSILAENRMAGDTGIQLTVTPEGALNFMGDPNATQQGRRLLKTLDLAKKAGATNQEIADAIRATAAPQVAPPQVAPQIPPEVAPQIEALNVQLAKVQAKRLDPTLSIDDYEAIEELDRQEREITNQIQSLKQPTVAKQQIPAAPPPPETVAKQQIEPTIEDQVRAQKSEERRQRQAEQEAKKGEFVLQNRDRAGAASLEQMRGIANNPDYGRAGFSRTPDGAPIVAFGDFAPEQLGREDVVTTARGRKIPVQYAVMEADDILTSNDIDGRPNLKYGDKDVPGTRAIAGNGRVTGIREAFNYRGRTEPYIEGMLADTALHGVDQDVIAGMKKPILVRVMPEEGLTRDIGDELNMSGMLELSPVEQARNDLNRVDFESLTFDEDGEITPSSLGQFINAQPVEERSKLVDRGLPTKQARQRLENAIFARAYDDDDLIAMFAQTEDPEAKLVINAMAQVAPQMAKLEGAGDLDIRDIVTDAAKIIISGKRRGLKLKEIASQVDMTVDPDTRIIVDLFAQNPRSNKQAIEALNNAADIAYRESIRPEEGLFGAEPRMERREVIERMRRDYEPGRTQDVAQAQRPGAAPSDVERQAKPGPAAVPPADQEFQLTGQTREELAELERKEKTGQAQREQEEREARAIAERERDIFTLQKTAAQPTPTAPPLRPTGDMFGATGMAEQPPRTFTPPTKATLFEEEEAGSAIKKLEEGVTRFASGMSSLSDLNVAMRTRAGYRKNGVGVDVGLLSKNALDSLAKMVINLRTPVFIDSGAFSAFTKKLRGKDSPALDFDKILEKYDSILEKIADANPSEEQDYPKPMLVMPDIVGDQAGSVSLIENYKDWIRGEALGNLSQPIIPIQKGKLSLSEVYDQIKGILGTDKFIVGVPSQEEAVSRQELADFLGTSKPPKVHFLGAASARKLTPLLAIVAEKSPDTQVSADASKVRSAILNGVAQGKTREDAIIDALRQEEDPAELIENYYAQAGEKKPAEAEESFKETVEIYVKDISSGTPTSSTATDYDEAANTITYVETWEGDFRTPTEELDELISGANKSDTAKGAKYSILVKDTPTESVVMTFQPRGRKPTDKYVDVFMSVQKTTKEKPERTYKEEVEFRTKQKRLDDPGISKEIQEVSGVSKPVADAYVRALRQRVEEQAKWTYGLGSEQAYVKAHDEVTKIENRIRGIQKRKETKQEKAAGPTPGDIIESIDLPDNMQVRILKAADGFSVQMYDKDSDNVVDGSVTIFKDSVFDEDAFKIAKEYADNLANEVRQEAKEAEEVEAKKEEKPAKTPREFYMEMIPAAGFKRLDPNDPRRYTNKAGREFLTFERDGVRVAVESNMLLYANDRGVTLYMGEGTDLTIQALLVDEGVRRQGRATKAMQDILDLADQAGMTTYIEPVQMSKGVGMSTPQLKEYYKRFGFEPQKTEPATDKVMVRTPKPVKAVKAKEPVAGPTFAGMQAEIDRIKAVSKAMGIETAPSATVPDTTKQKQAEKKKKEEAKKLKQATRSEIEYARFDDIGSDPIQATPEQLKMAKELAAQVKGELVFFDKDLNLGLVVVPNNFGFEDYFPIHGGKISKVDVAEYTGLSTIDKSFLNRIARSIRVFRETSGKMLAGTAEQQEGILAVAEELAATPVYFDPASNVGLVRGYALITGQPIYAATIGNSYSKVDVENTTVAALLPYKAELIAVKKRLEEEAEKRHQESPFVNFEKGIASDGIDDSMLGVITEWKSMLGLDNVNIYFSTVEEATKNRDKFTGPHRVIGSGTLDQNEKGSTRRMSDGSYYVLFKKSTSKTAMLEIIAHELGHVHEKEAYETAPQELKNKLKEAHAKWVDQRKGKTPREAIEMLRAKTTAQTTGVSKTKTRAEELSPYWSSFSEWYADQVSRWAVTDEKPVGAVEKFFARLGAALRRFYQTLKGQKFLPNETFVQYLNQVNPVIVEAIPGPIKEPVQIEMSFKMQKDLFGSPEEAKKIEEIMEPKVKKLPPGRSPELTAAAQAVKAGTMTAEEFNKLVDIYKPIPMYAEPLKPATSEQVFDALDVKKREQINPSIPNGTSVGLRLDIPAFNRKGVFVVSIHQKRTASAPGKVIGYGSVAKAKNVTFGVGNQLKALDIAAGEAKDALQTIEGEYVNITPEQAFAEAQRAIKDPSYVQVGIDPTRHAYFYDRSTTLPVVSAEEVIQIGNMILAKKPVFGKKENFLYNIESGPTPGMNKEEFKALLEELRKEDDAKREVERQEKIAYYASIRRREVELQKKVREYGSTIDIQRQLNNLNRLARELKEDIDLDKSPVYTAENFLRQARAALEGRTPYKEQAISADVFAVIQAMYMDDPKLLEGLRLSIKPEFTPEEALLRSAFGYPRASGAFESFRRVVYLYTGTKGVDNPSTIRHEITHTLEQMMTPAQRQAVISSYFNAVEKAAKKHKDARSQEFFEKLGEFLNNPNPKTKSALDKALPSYDFYQYVNPSEYWAVNAEKLMAQRMGPAWERFKKAVRKMFEKLKDIFGFDNRYAVHQVFDQVMGGSKKRLTKDMLADFIFSSGERFEFLENIEDDAELMRRSGRADTPMLDVSPMKRIMIRGATNAKESFKEMVENPSEILRMTFNPINRGIIYLRNKNIWFGTGLNEADRIRYNGQVRTSENIATASLALDNMIRGGNIATQVLFRGGIEYNPDTLMFGAVEKEQSMTKVYEAEARLKNKLGEQLGTNIIQGYLEAKRSRSIKEEVVSRQQTLETLQEFVNDKVAELKALDANPNATEKEINKVNKELRSLFREFQDAKKDLETIKKIAEDKVSMSEEMIEEFISRENVHPELREIMDNFSAVNQNMLTFWRQVGLISENRYNTLSRIKDYVPWYRIMNDEEDVHSPLQATTRSATNIGKEKLFGPGKPSVINDFIIEENQNVFKIQPGRVNAVKLEGKKLKPEDYEVTPQGEVTLKVPYKPGDVLIVETQREIENMIDNMTRNVMRMTMNGLRQYAAQRIVSEYATRDSDGKIMTFNKTDVEKGRFDFIVDGRRTVVEIQDPLLAEAVLGMESVGMQMWKPLAAAANFTRRTITLSPVFQVKQVFKDAPTAALVTGVKNPAALVGGVYKGFIDALRDSDPAAGILRSVGIGGFYSPARTPEADVKRQIGIINNSTYDYVLKALDHFGDSSDMAQRIAIYNRVLAETGDEALAMYQASNVINFLRHGSGQVAQALVKTVPFLNAYAQSIDVLYNALIGGGLRGLDRKKAMQRLFITGSLLAGTTLLYAMLVGDDDDYMKMDDQAKVRSYMIPGTDIVLPMNTSAAFFFKAIPELVYNYVVTQGTENAVDEKRLRTAMKEAAVDMLLGPTPVPSAVKPVVEISLNYDFFTSRPVVPAGLKDLDAYQQYDMRTSEAAKSLSALTGTKENRLLNPVEADHLIRGIFGTAGGMVAWSSNLIGEASEIRPAMGLKEMPITGAFLRPEVPRGREDLFYALKESTDRKFKTFNRLADRDLNEAQEYLQKHPNLISFYDYTSEMDTQLKELNAAIRFIAETTDRSYTPEMKRKEIQELLNLKQEILEGVEMFRREAYSE